MVWGVKPPTPPHPTPPLTPSQPQDPIQGLGAAENPLWGLRGKYSLPSCQEWLFRRANSCWIPAKGRLQTRCDRITQVSKPLKVPRHPITSLYRSFLIIKRPYSVDYNSSKLERKSPVLRSLSSYSYLTQYLTILISARLAKQHKKQPPPPPLPAWRPFPRPPPACFYSPSENADGSTNARF